MFNVCPSCGNYNVEKEIRLGEDAAHALAICPGCGYAHPFLRLPLFVITGASGTGKSTLALRLPAEDQRCVHLESDILWRSEFNHPEDNYREYRNLWLRLAKNIAQAGLPVALYGSVTPGQFEPCPERRYLGQIQYLALVCEPAELERRLRARPAWRGAGGDEFVSAMLRFNHWFCENAANTQPAITLLDTTHAGVAETTAAVREWISANWSPL